MEYKCPFNIKNMSILEGRSKTDFLESKEGKIRLRRRHKYCTQVIGQMASSAGEKTFFVVWTPKGEPLIELIHFDLQHWKAVLANLVIFFNTHIQRVSLGLRDLCYLLACDKLRLEPDEFEEDSENSLQCELWSQSGLCWPALSNTFASPVTTLQSNMEGPSLRRSS